MLKLSGNTIYVTKGDTVDLSINITNKDGEPYEPNPDDSIRFALKKKYTDENTLIFKEISVNDLRLRIESQETKELSVRDSPYVYDIQLTMPDGTVDTFIDREKMYITEEVD